MDKSSVEENTFTLEPGCVLGQTMHILAEQRKAVPHGWDLILSRRCGYAVSHLSEDASYAGMGQFSASMAITTRIITCHWCSGQATPAIDE